MIETVAEVIEILGGTGGAAAVARVGPSAVSNWKARGAIPTEHYFLIAAELRKVGKEVSPVVFGAGQAESAA